MAASFNRSCFRCKFPRTLPPNKDVLFLQCILFIFRFTKIWKQLYKIQRRLFRSQKKIKRKNWNSKNCVRVTLFCSHINLKKTSRPHTSSHPHSFCIFVRRLALRKNQQHVFIFVFYTASKVSGALCIYFQCDIAIYQIKIEPQVHHDQPNDNSFPRSPF